mmetsp:Transcript_52125/g.130957  ORF Transcript_52125/g.130957 Transcript_52125/m.130957 type:complete len:93 (+) Transcript_52125:623-901(+)
MIEIASYSFGWTPTPTPPHPHSLPSSSLVSSHVAVVTSSSSRRGEISPSSEKARIRLEWTPDVCLVLLWCDVCEWCAGCLLWDGERGCVFVC